MLPLRWPTDYEAEEERDRHAILENLNVDSGSLSQSSRGSSLMRESGDAEDEVLPPKVLSRHATDEDDTIPPRQGCFDEETSRWYFNPQRSRHEDSSTNSGKQPLTKPLSGAIDFADIKQSPAWEHEDHDVKDYHSSNEVRGAFNGNCILEGSDSEVPPLLPHLASDPVALRQWASVAVAELQALRFGEKHRQLHITSLENEIERFERELRNTVAAKVQAEETAMLLRARSSGPGPQQSSSLSSPPTSLTAEELALPLLRGKLLEEAKQKLGDSEKKAASFARDCASLRSALVHERKRATLEGGALRDEVRCLAGQLAQRSLLYEAHEKRWKVEERGLERVNLSSVKAMAHRDGEFDALKGQVRELKTSLAAAGEAKALAEAKADSEASQCSAQRKAAEEAQREQSASAGEVAGLREEVARLRVADVAEMEAAWATQLEKLTRQHDEQRRDLSAALQQSEHASNNEREKSDDLGKQVLRWSDESDRLRQECGRLQDSVRAFASGGRDKAMGTLLQQLKSARDELAAVLQSKERSSGDNGAINDSAVPAQGAEQSTSHLTPHSITAPWSAATTTAMPPAPPTAAARSTTAQQQKAPKILSLAANSNGSINEPFAAVANLLPASSTSSSASSTRAEENLLHQHLFSSSLSTSLSHVRHVETSASMRACDDDDDSSSSLDDDDNVGDGGTDYDGDDRGGGGGKQATGNNEGREAFLVAQLEERSAKVQELERELNVLTRGLEKMQNLQQQQQQQQRHALAGPTDENDSAAEAAEAAAMATTTNTRTVHDDGGNAGGAGNDGDGRRRSGVVAAQALKLRSFLERTCDGDALRKAALFVLDKNVDMANARAKDESVMGHLRAQLHKLKLRANAEAGPLPSPSSSSSSTTTVQGTSLTVTHDDFTADRRVEEEEEEGGDEDHSVGDDGDDEKATETNQPPASPSLPPPPSLSSVVESLGQRFAQERLTLEAGFEERLLRELARAVESTKAEAAAMASAVAMEAAEAAAAAVAAVEAGAVEEEKDLRVDDAPNTLAVHNNGDSGGDNHLRETITELESQVCALTADLEATKRGHAATATAAAAVATQMAHPVPKTVAAEAVEMVRAATWMEEDGGAVGSVAQGSTETEKKSVALTVDASVGTKDHASHGDEDDNHEDDGWEHCKKTLGAFDASTNTSPVVTADKMTDTITLTATATAETAIAVVAGGGNGGGEEREASGESEEKWLRSRLSEVEARWSEEQAAWAAERERYECKAAAAAAAAAVEAAATANAVAGKDDVLATVDVMVLSAASAAAEEWAAKEEAWKCERGALEMLVRELQTKATHETGVEGLVGSSVVKQVRRLSADSLNNDDGSPVVDAGHRHRGSATALAITAATATATAVEAGASDDYHRDSIALRIEVAESRLRLAEAAAALTAASAANEWLSAQREKLLEEGEARGEQHAREKQQIQFQMENEQQQQQQQHQHQQQGGEKEAERLRVCLAREREEQQERLNELEFEFGVRAEEGLEGLRKELELQAAKELAVAVGLLQQEHGEREAELRLLVEQERALAARARVEVEVSTAAAAAAKEEAGAKATRAAEEVATAAASAVAAAAKAGEAERRVAAAEGAAAAAAAREVAASAAAAARAEASREAAESQAVAVAEAVAAAQKVVREGEEEAVLERLRVSMEQPLREAMAAEMASEVALVEAEMREDLTAELTSALTAELRLEFQGELVKEAEKARREAQAAAAAAKASEEETTVKARAMAAMEAAATAEATAAEVGERHRVSLARAVAATKERVGKEAAEACTRLEAELSGALEMERKRAKLAEACVERAESEAALARATAKTAAAAAKTEAGVALAAAVEAAEAKAAVAAAVAAAAVEAAEAKAAVAAAETQAAEAAAALAEDEEAEEEKVRAVAEAVAAVRLEERLVAKQAYEAAVSELEGKWAAEREGLVAKCEAILAKTTVAASRLRRQHERSSHNASRRKQTATSSSALPPSAGTSATTSIARASHDSTASSAASSASSAASRVPPQTHLSSEPPPPSSFLASSSLALPPRQSSIATEPAFSSSSSSSALSSGLETAVSDTSSQRRQQSQHHHHHRRRRRHDERHQQTDEDEVRHFDHHSNPASIGWNLETSEGRARETRGLFRGASLATSSSVSSLRSSAEVEMLQTNREGPVGVGAGSTGEEEEGAREEERLLHRVKLTPTPTKRPSRYD